MTHDTVRGSDPAVADALEDERERQRATLTVIASENHVSEAVVDARSSELTDVYAEDYPGARYYGGRERADEVEQLAIDRAREPWGSSTTPALTTRWFEEERMREVGDLIAAEHRCTSGTGSKRNTSEVGVVVERRPGAGSPSRRRPRASGGWPRGWRSPRADVGSVRAG